MLHKHCWKALLTSIQLHHWSHETLPLYGAQPFSFYRFLRLSHRIANINVDKRISHKDSLGGCAVHTDRLTFQSTDYTTLLLLSLSIYLCPEDSNRQFFSCRRENEKFHFFFHVYHNGVYVFAKTRLNLVALNVKNLYHNNWYGIDYSKQRRQFKCDI